MARRKLAGVSLALVALVLAGLWLATDPSPMPGKGVPASDAAVVRGGGRILLTWGVGGVLTEDGTLWQYRPDKSRWVTIDESFRMDGEQRRVLPLPVPARQVLEMQGFGFLVARNGTSWLYDLDSNRWRSLGAP